MGGDQPDAEQFPGRDQDDAPPLLDDESVYRALASTRRRRLLAVLLDGAERTVEELATMLAGWQATDTSEMVTPDERKRIVVELHHVHLPQLDEAGLIAHDREEATVRLEQLDDAVAELLRRSVELDGEGG